MTTDSPARHSVWTDISGQLAQAIARGELQPGQRMPSEHALAQSFGVHRHTVRRALADLVQRGLVRASQGSGTFVEDFAVDLALGKRTRHRHSLDQAGVRGALQVIEGREVAASADVARALDVRARSKVLHLQVLGEGAGQPLHVSERWFPLPRFRGLQDHVQASGSITQAFAALGVADYTRRESRIAAVMPTPDVAEQLKQSPSRPVLRVSSVNVDREGRPIEFANTWFAGDRVTLTVQHDDH